MSTTSKETRVFRFGWITLMVIAVLLVLFGLFVLFSPIDPSDFESTTGESWDAFSSSNPEVAVYLEREARLLAVATTGIGIFAASLVWFGIREDSDLAVKIMWTLPVVLIGSAAVFVVGDGLPLAGFYAAVTALAAFALARVGRAYN